MVKEEQWQKLLNQFAETKRSLFHGGTLGILKYMDSVCPLEARLKEGERSDDLFWEIAVVVNEHRLDQELGFNALSRSQKS